MKVNKEMPGPTSPNNDESKWIWGIFYFNKNDKRLFPPKQRGWMGWTVNFANPYSIASIILILAGLICIGKVFI